MAHHAGLYRRRQYWYFKYKDENGKWIEHATRTIDRKKALSIKSGFLRELETGQLPNDRSQWTFGKAAEAWLLDRKLRVARSSYFSEKTIVGSLERHLGTETKLTKLANIHSINQYQTVRLKEGLSPKTVNNEVLALGSILREASLWHRVSEQYKPLRFRKSDIGQALDREERIRLLQVAGLASPTAVAPYAAVLATGNAKPRDTKTPNRLNPPRREQTVFIRSSLYHENKRWGTLRCSGHNGSLGFEPPAGSR